MKKVSLILIAIVFIFGCSILSGCREEFKNVDEFEKHIKDKQALYEETISKNGVRLRVKYCPTEEMMIRYYKDFEKRGKQILSNTISSTKEKDDALIKAKSMLNKTKEDYEKSIYFILSIEYVERGKDIIISRMNAGFDKYSDWLEKLLFSLNNYIYLETAKENDIKLSLYHMERTFGLTKDVRFMLAFPRYVNNVDLLNEKNEQMKLNISEFGLKTGDVSFVFELPFENLNSTINSI